MLYVSTLIRAIINGDKKDEIHILGLTWHKNSIVGRLPEVSCEIREREFTKPQDLNEYNGKNNRI